MHFPTLTIYFILLSLNQNPLPPNQVPSLGAVSWERDFAKSKQRSILEEKPILILFTSFYGEHTAEEYGRTVLRNPLICEAIERHFIPLVINNLGNKEDDLVMEFFNEPHGNKPVINIYEPGGRLNSDRLSGNYSASELLMTMIMSLGKRAMEIPLFMRILAAEEPVQDPDFHLNSLKDHPIRFVPLSKRQSQIVQNAIDHKKNFQKYLSPNQLLILNEISSKPKGQWVKHIAKLPMKRPIQEILLCLKKINGNK